MLQFAFIKAEFTKACRLWGQPGSVGHSQFVGRENA
jgi:hypothetical protein